MSNISSLSEKEIAEKKMENCILDWMVNLKVFLHLELIKQQMDNFSWVEDRDFLMRKRISIWGFVRQSFKWLVVCGWSYSNTKPAAHNHLKKLSNKNPKI